MTDRSPALALKFPWKPLAGAPAPSLRDMAVFALVIGALALVAVGARPTLQPLAPEAQALSLDPANLPFYALRTTLRMIAAMGVSLVFTFVFGVIAAKSRRAETVLVPLIDILQSVPVLGFLTFTVAFFLALFPGQVLGAEFAAIFAVFTSQAWNMAISFYQSVKSAPKDLRDVSDQFRLSAWKRFWTLEAPYAAPGLVWNAMVSMSGGWFFVVQSEAITVGATTVRLPGVGSYLALAIARSDLAAVGWAVLTMLAVIVLYDQLLFRPLVAWSERFSMDQSPSGAARPARSWLLDLLRQARWTRLALAVAADALGRVARLGGSGRRRETPVLRASAAPRGWIDGAWYAVLAAAGAAAAWGVARFVGSEVSWAEAGHVLVLGAFTLTRVMVLLAIASLVWVPIGVLIGLRPRLAATAQPIVQFLAAFPANLFFPVAVITIVRFRLAPDVWLSPLMILGAQWYILFNVIGAASVFPGDLREVASSFRVKGWSWWRKVALPGIMPGYLTGAITAAGGAWNAAIVAEAASWGDTKLTARGLGAYIVQNSVSGDLPRVVLGVAVMSGYVLLLNSLVWRPLFAAATRRVRAG